MAHKKYSYCDDLADHEMTTNHSPEKASLTRKYNNKSRDFVEKAISFGYSDSSNTAEMMDDEAAPSKDVGDDLVRIYLTQMGGASLLTQEEELIATEDIGQKRKLYSDHLLGTDYMIARATEILERVAQKKLRLDRTIEISVGDKATKVAILKMLPPNLQTLRKILLENRKDFCVVMRRKSSAAEKKAAWIRLQTRRMHAVRLIQELGLRANLLKRAHNEQTRIFERMGQLKEMLESTRKSKRQNPLERWKRLHVGVDSSPVEIRAELHRCMRLTLETVSSARKRIEVNEKLQNDYNAARNQFSTENLRYFSITSSYDIC